MHNVNKCKQCKSKLKQIWNYCPGCGEPLLDEVETLFRKLFTEMQNHLYQEDGLDSLNDHRGKAKTGRMHTEKSKTMRSDGSQNTKTINKVKKSSLSKVKQEEMGSWDAVRCFGKIENPQTHVRRLTDYIIYVLKVPGVKRKRDVLIDQIGSTTEIKAYAKDRIYFKVLHLQLAVAKYSIKGNELTIKFKPMGV